MQIQVDEKIDTGLGTLFHLWAKEYFMIDA